MKSKYIILVLCCFYWLFFVFTSSAQDYSISGVVKEKYFKGAIPFTHIIVNHHEAEFLSNEDGEFTIHYHAPIKQLEFRQYQYRTLVVPITNNSDSLQVELSQNSLFEFEQTSNVPADRLIFNVLARKKQNDAESNIPHSFNTYNKLIIETNKLKETKKILEKNLKLLGIKLKTFKKEHNLFIIESATEKKYLNDLNQRENIVASKISGVDESSIYTISSTLLPGSIYNNYISLATFTFLSPLNEKALSNYYFRIIDTVRQSSQSTYVVKFSPAKKNTDALKGLLYINSGDYAVTGFIMLAAYDAPPFKIVQSYSNNKGKWYPNTTRTDYLLKTYGKENIRINVVAKIYRSNLVWRNDLKVSDFDDVILKDKKSSNSQNEAFWDSVRQEPLSRLDSNTYAFYDTIGSVKRFERYTTLGEGIYNGIIPISIYNFEVNRFLSANEYEGFRIGIGGYTNNLLSDRYSIGGYIGYGTNDGKVKYGVRGKYIIDKKTEFTISSSYYKDLKEAGGLSFSFDKKQFPTESLRYYRLTYLDQILCQNFEISIKPIRYVYLSSALNLEEITPTYAYYYKDDLNKVYGFSEYKIGLKLAFGEQFIQSPQNKFLLGSKYPILWLEYRKGFKDFIGNYDYNKWDFKLQYSFKKPGIGRQTIQINSGLAKGDLPYFKLYNMQGSWRTFSVVIHNSFETMRYNEFLSNQYLAIHYAHDLGKIHIRKPLFEPGIEILHNFGVGALKNKGDHQLIGFKTMEKGYFESGVFIYDVLTIRALGLRTGLGTGVFVRYGPYARDKFVDNFLYKLGLSFKL